MISLQIASLERVSKERMEELDFIHMNRYEEYDAHSHPIFLSRRVGFCIIKFFDEYYKLPHHYVSDDIDEGEEVLSICRECFSKTMYDTEQNAFYCPYCER